MKISWGNVGINDVWGSLEVEDPGAATMGVLREVWPGVDYLGPPEGVGLPAWRADPQDTLGYQMPLGDNQVPPKSWSLEELQQNLRQKRDNGTLQADDPNLVLLDWAASQLLQVTANLHASRRGLGLAHPGNVLIVKHDGERRLVLPDLGFIWRSEAGAEAPDWLEKSRWKFLWDKSPRAVNSLIIEGSPALVEHDRRTLARLLAFLMVGRETLKGWGSEGRALAHFPEEDPEAEGDAWLMLQDLLEGKQASLSEANRLIRESPLSAHYLRKVKVKGKGRDGRGGRLLLRLALGAAVVAAAAGSVAWLTPKVRDRIVGLDSATAPAQAAPLCPDCPGTTALAPVLKKIEAGRGKILALRGEVSAGRKKFKDELAALREELADLVALHKVELHGYDRFRTKEQACLSSIRLDFVKELEKAYLQLREQLNNKSDDSDYECPDIQGLEGAVVAVLGLDPPMKEPSWFEDLKETRRLICGR